MVGSSLGGWTNVQVSPPDAQAYPVDGFEFYTEETNDNRYNRIDYNVARYKVETDEKTYYRVSQIIYLYVSKDVTLSAQSGQNEGFIYTAFDLSLKAGWNLLQMDVGGDLTQPSGTLSIHIATKNVPWTVNVTGGSTNDSSEGEDSVKCISMLNAPSGFSTSAVVGIIPTGTSPSGIDDPAFVAGREFSITDTLDTVDGSTVTFYLYDSRYRNQNGVSIIPWTGTGVFDVYVATSATALSGKMFANVAITESVTPLDYNEGVNFDLRKPTVGDNRGARR
jgi:hypothetical protein